MEATALGNVLVQAIGLGALGGLAEAREVVRRSFDVKRYEPRRTEGCIIGPRAWGVGSLNGG